MFKPGLKTVFYPYFAYKLCICSLPIKDEHHNIIYEYFNIHIFEWAFYHRMYIAFKKNSIYFLCNYFYTLKGVLFVGLTAKQLLALCKSVVNNPDFQPSGGVTYCNLAVISILNQAVNVHTFDGMLANGICNALAKNSSWITCTATEAQNAANSGGIVIAAATSAMISSWSDTTEYHGHVAVVCPGKMVLSSHWDGYAPLIANVGATNGIMGANWAFIHQPLFYLYQEQLPSPQPKPQPPKPSFWTTFFKWILSLLGKKSQ